MITEAPVEIGGRTYLDGGILDPIPVVRAIADGATKITVVLDNPYTNRRRDLPCAPRCKGAFSISPGRHRPHQQIKWETLQKALNPVDGVDIRVVRPPRWPGVTRLSRDMERIDDAMALGREVGHDELAQWRSEPRQSIKTPY